MEVTDIKSALDAHGKAIDEAMAKYDARLKDLGEVDESTKSEVRALTEKFEATVTELAQKMEGANSGPAAELTAGQEFVKSEQFKQLAGRQIQMARVSVKNTVVTGSTTTFADHRPGVIPGSFDPLTVRQLIPTISVNSNMVNSLRELSWTNDAAETTEGASKPESDITFEQYNVPITTVAHWIKVSEQLLADAPAVVSYIDTRLRDGLAQRIEQQIIVGNGTAPNLSGLTDSGNFTAFTPAVGANLADSINAAKYTMWAAGNAPDTVIVNPADWAALEILRADSGTGAYLYGVPGTNAGMSVFGVQVVLSNHVPAGEFIIAALRRSATIYQRQGATVEMGFVNDDFTKNLVTIRAEERLGLAVDRPSGIYYGDITSVGAG